MKARCPTVARWSHATTADGRPSALTDWFGNSRPKHGRRAEYGESPMSRVVVFELELPETLEQLRLPAGVDERLMHLLDLQSENGVLTPEERLEAEGLVDLADLLSLLRLRATRLGS
jgi:hypothetical protein